MTQPPFRLHPPQRLWLVRHGESAGNVALAAAHALGHHRIDVSARDADVPLSPLGERQARALGRWFAASRPEERPTLVLSSPYLRAHQTAQIALEAANLPDVPLLTDERLREREFGALNRLTKAGIEALMPEQAELRRAIGKFYYRPPGGESWCDILLRLRSLWTTLREDHGDERVLIVCHSVVTLCFRCVLEGLTEAEILRIDADNDIANCGVTSYLAGVDAGGRPTFALDRFNFVAPVEDAGEEVTREPDAPRAK
jgi:broad specificity phosphatase PhoE